MPLRSLQGFINSVCKLAKLPLPCPHYACISQQTKTVNIAFKTKTKGAIQHLAVDSTGLKAYDKDKWKANKHDTDGKLRVWRKLHLAEDIHTYQIDGEVLPNLLKQTHQRINEISGGDACDARQYY
ncbi:Mobile element protein [Candidatus Enterovibrio altilux]|uniref:Mobile element protein n=1 Tax=Candidatus Enterovibrio altilux TaxID=1927128 RepID=A0A291BA88_9GAMM|nr:Mobile element protein [Candidatus Enterovibrio luxaltus]